jgi:hypothetical protein
VKLYVEEDGSASVRNAVARASSVFTVRVSYVEARAAFVRQRREGGLAPRELRRVVREFDQDWRTYGIVEVTDALAHRAGVFAERFALRAYDALQLAAAAELRDAGTPVEFASFDERLDHAARRAHLLPAAR